ncbi:possible Uncharacterized protein family UPF005 [Prochlorococcus marinus str. MIT 9515]|uniref:Possible Uncharacterized protein family UPF005 n=1 Tax=Prochlorococcus marinus (strain MIT 9515) TaxID=167542 RepID=A2BXJ0_PROM5|nr:possible Uncharacterized protein family UPF005 [Prochlorococcus marinus str. MIT 9515]
MKYLFLFSEKFYGLIEWEWNFLKQLRRKKRKNIFLRSSFALFSLISICSIFFFPPYFLGILLGEGIKFNIFFIWLWILNLKYF